MRQIKEEWGVSEALDDAREKWSGTDIAWEAITFAVSHDPDSPDSEALTDSGRLRTWTYEGARSIDQPTIVVIYEWNAIEVHILEARFSDSKYGPAGRA